VALPTSPVLEKTAYTRCSVLQGVADVALIVMRYNISASTVVPQNSKPRFHVHML